MDRPSERVHKHNATKQNYAKWETPVSLMYCTCKYLLFQGLLHQIRPSLVLAT